MEGATPDIERDIPRSALAGEKFTEAF